MVTIKNTGISTVTLVHESSSVSAQYRFNLPQNSNFVLSDSYNYIPEVTVVYNGSRWIIVATNIATGGGAIVSAEYPNIYYPSIYGGTLVNSTITSGTLTTPTIGTAGFNLRGLTSGTTKITAAATAGGTVVVPAGAGTLASLAGTETLANKTLTTPNIGAATGTSLNVTGTVSAAALGGTLLSSATPTSLSGAAAVGTSVIPSRQDHQHGTSGLITTSTNAAGDISGSFSALTLGTTGVTAGTYSKLTVDTKGRITAGAIASISDLSAPTSAVSFGTQRITNLATPTTTTDAVTKAYVDAVATGLDIKASVRVATTGSIALTGTQSIDNILVAVGDRVLVKNQGGATPNLNNGIYVAASGAWTRATDFDAIAAPTAGAFMFVTEGVTNGDTGWVLITDDPISIGTTALSFSQFATSPILSSTTPSDIASVASVGTLTTAARADHIHSTGANITVSGTVSAAALGGAVLSSVTPGTLSASGTSGAAVTVSRSDHTHPNTNLLTTATASTGSGNLVYSTGGTLIGPNLGTPSVAFLNNATQLPIGTGVSGLAANVATFLGTPSSANLLSAITTETGTGTLVFNTSPILVTPNLGTPSAINLTNATGLPNSATSGVSTATANTLALRDASAGLSVVGLGLAGTTSGTTTIITAAAASGTVLMPAGAGTVATLTAAQTFTNKTINLGTNTLQTTLAQLSTAVSDGTVASTTGVETLYNKTFVAPVLGTATGTSLSVSGNLTSTAGTISALALGGSLLVTSAPAALSSAGTYGAGTLPARSDHAHPTSATKLSIFGTTSSAELASIITDETGSGQLVFSGGTTGGGPQLYNANLVATSETINVVASAVTAATINVDVLTASVWYYTGTASANAGTVNFRGNATTTLGTLVATGESITVVFMQTNGTTAYKPALFQIDGTTFTPKWQGGTVTTGNASAIDAYTFTIIKTAATPTYTVLGAQTKYV